LRLRSACALGLLALTGLAARAAAAENGDFFSGLMAPAVKSVDYQLRESPARRSQDPDILENRVRASFPLAKASSDTWSLQQDLGSFHLSRSPVIGPSGPAIPRDLWNVETGADFRRALADRRGWGVSASVGSASDEPYHSLHETTLKATGNYHIPSGRDNSWLFFLAYSNNRHFANNVPFPGAAYLVRAPEHGLDAVIGLPFFAVRYRPAPRWSGKLAVFGPDNVSAELAYQLPAAVETYAGFDWNQREWLRADRPDNSQRLFFDEKRWSLGLRCPLRQGLRMDLSGGYEFGRRLYESTRARSSGLPEADLDPAWTIGAKLSLRL